MKKTLAACSAASLAALLVAGCSSSGGAATPKGTSGGGGSLIGVDYPRSDTDFWNSYISYVPKFAKDLGAKIKTTNSQNDVQKLIANIQALQSQGAKAFVMAPQDTAAIAPELDLAGHLVRGEVTPAMSDDVFAGDVIVAPDAEELDRFA